jgi:hypothetical protein
MFKGIDLHALDYIYLTREDKVIEWPVAGKEDDGHVEISRDDFTGWTKRLYCSRRANRARVAFQRRTSPLGTNNQESMKLYVGYMR